MMSCPLRVVVMVFRAHAQEGLSPGMLCIVTVETLGRFPAGKTWLGLYFV